MASPFSRRTKIGPKSRVQPRFVGKRRKSTRARSTPAFSRMRLASACWTRELTRMRTTSPGASLRTISPYTKGIGGNFPGQSVTLCGQPIQVAACGSHSAGMRTRLVSEEPVLNAAVRVGAPVAQERPVAADFLDSRQIDLGEHEGLVLGRLGDQDPERVADERVTPEFDSRAPPRAAELLEADTVHRGDPTTVRDRVTALDRFPGIELLLAVLLFLRGVPTDRGGIKQNVRPLQPGEPGTLGIPLIPADQRADRTDLRIECAKTEITRREVELLVVGGVVGDVHLAVDPLHLPVGVDDRGRVVIQTGSPALEQRRNDDDTVLLRDLAERLGRQSGDRLGQ